jgi:hypothetical protein
MSDLLAPFLMLYPDDGRAFMCFRALMARVRGNFVQGQQPMMRQMATVMELITRMDAPMGAHLHTIGAGDGVWSFRMLLVMMRREMAMQEVFTFWEVLWAGQTLFGGTKALLPAVVATFMLERRQQVMDFSESHQVLEMCNNAQGEVDGTALVHGALVRGVLDTRQRKKHPISDRELRLGSRGKAVKPSKSKPSFATRRFFLPRRPHYSVVPTTDLDIEEEEDEERGQRGRTTPTVEVVHASKWGSCLHFGLETRPPATVKPTMRRWRSRKGEVAVTQPQVAWRREESVSSDSPL